MAATDKPFNNQRTLDIVFGVSNILLLLSIVWMLYQDHFREYKVEQRLFRDVEVQMAQRAALNELPNADDFKKARETLEGAIKKRDEKKDDIKAAHAELARLQPKKERAESNYQAVKAEVDSKNSFLDLALEERNEIKAEQVRRELAGLNVDLDKMQAERDDIVLQMKKEQQKISVIEEPVTKATADFKKVSDKLDTQVKLALSKRWGWGDWIRTQPVINGFADPLKIHQFTIKDVTIDYNFVQAVRYDRCMTCHQGIDRANYTAENLRALSEDAPNADNLEAAKEVYKDRKAAVENDPDALRSFLATTPNPNEISLRPVKLSEARIKQFAAHPRLDLFVGGNSKHPAERFGCSACHYGQGSGTTFLDASHSPNTMKERHHWEHDRHWETNHMWDFPMLPTRFAESSCLKCHHEVTDLVSTDNRQEAPKLLRGYGLIKENGCFGCHEISGWKSGNRIGPDMRLEPFPALDDHVLVTPREKDRAEKDTDNRPGTMRKVGPSLARLHEKTTLSWVEKWVRSPRSFRPDTKMPHYYGLSTNTEDYLRDEHKKLVEAAKAAGKEVDSISQEKFPNTEIAAIAHFVMKTSQTYADDAEKARNDGKAAKDLARRDELVNKDRLVDKEPDELAEIKRRIRLRKEVKLVDLAPKHEGDPKSGRMLFTEKGCLACHSHKGTETSLDVKGFYSPGVKSEAVFGPNLTQLRGKFGASKEEIAAARKWLIQWILDPHVHSPRSRMPVTHLTPEQAADVAAWLLEQKSEEHGDDWDKIKLAKVERKDLEDLAKVYLVRMLSKSDMNRFVKGELKKEEFEIIEKDLTFDEQQLHKKGIKNDDELKFYLGKKAVTRLGCFGCHDIPGFETTKSIGVGLNDWGKKPADRLAFEDIENFFKAHYYDQVDGKPVDSRTDDQGKPYPIVKKDGKELEPYESFYSAMLLGHFKQREGYLNQKVRDPRSYDFNRARTWDDRSRMPQFAFSRPKKTADEKADDYRARVVADEALARESVATFVLGLTAEAVPAKSVNQPTGDRLAEVKGRQVLEKYNCNGCHQIRPGVYDFKPSKKTIEGLDDAHRLAAKALKEEIVFSNHIYYTGRNVPEPARLTTYAIKPRVNDGNVTFSLSEALRYVDKDKTVKNIPAGVLIDVPLRDLPSPTPIKTQADFDRFYASSAPFGGDFANLMVGYLDKKDRSLYGLTAGDNATARASLPPSLIGQGERTQTDWLTSFLLKPYPVRRMSILRMPQFNMSEEEARTLVHYFAAVTRQINPGIGLTYPSEVVPAKEDLSGEYWTKKTEAYIEYLKNTKEKNKEGKDTDKSLYQVRLDAYKRVWADLRKESEPGLNKTLEGIQQQAKDSQKSLATKEMDLKNAKDDKKAEIEKEINALKISLDILAVEEKNTKAAIAGLSEDAQQKVWETRGAYAEDGFRALMSRNLCTKCHQVGVVAAGEPGKQGPPLDQVSDRLRRDWVVRWVNRPARFVPDSLMPQYFKTNEMAHQDLLAGQALFQMEALRDVLLNYPRVANLPANRGYHPDRQPK